MKRILLVEDDENLGLSLKESLISEGYEVVWKKTYVEGQQEILSEKWDLAILDWQLPDGQGVDLLKEARQENHRFPIIMLTARVELIDRVLGLESGANDYITKPFEPRELHARIRVQLRASYGGNDGPSAKEVKVGSLYMNLDTREVLFNDESVELTKMEYELIRLFAETPNRVFSREEILNKVWGYDNFPTTRTVDTHILQLRQKLSDDLIETIRGIGYRLKEEGATA